MTHYPIGTLVRHRHFITRSRGIVKSIEVLGTKEWMGVEWFSSLEEALEEKWELISIEEIDNDEQF